jgi:3-hydroxybutyryl-CoA dehydrogenase
MLINEAHDAVFMGIASAEDVDTAMTLGVNYPRGLHAWTAEQGAAHWVQVLDALQQRYQEDRYRVSPLLRQLALPSA